MKLVNAMRLTEHQFTSKGCNLWYEWLKGRGIPCAIIQEESGNFAVWRQWEIRRKSTSKDYITKHDSHYYYVKSGPEKIKEPYNIVEHCNNFILSIVI